MTRTLVLVSGGLDSTAATALLMRRSPPELLFIDFGQLSRIREWEAAQRIAERYALQIERLDLGCPFGGRDDLPGRNGWLVMSALLAKWPFVGTIVLGIHAGSRYPDCSPTFISGMQSALDLYTRGTVRVLAPFLEWTKGEIVAFAEASGVPVHLTYSCELGRDQPCGQCLSCGDVEARLARA